MQYRTFGRTTLSVSTLGFGGAPVGYLATDVHAVTQLLNFLVDSGVNAIDTAASYRESEAVIGHALAARREQVILISKCGTGLSDLEGEPWSPRLIARSIDRSLSRLRTDRLDVCLLHSCSLEVLQKGEAIDALVQARRAGKIRHAGYSGDNQAAAFAAAHPELEVLQTSVNIADQYNIDHVLPIAREHNVGVMAKRPIADAAWNPSRPGLYASYGQTYEDRLKQMHLDPSRFGLTWPEMALRFVLSIPGAHTAIVGTTKLQNARANLAATEAGPLPEATTAAIRAAWQTADPRQAWRGET